MDISWNLFLAIGLLTKLLFGYEAPGTLILKITYSMDTKTESSNQAELHSIITTGYITVYNNKNQLRSNKNNRKLLETTISFEINNISALLSYTGRLRISLNNKRRISRTIEFIKPSFHFLVKKFDTQKATTVTFYNNDFEKELGVVLTAKCRRNFYPQSQCSVMCIESENTEYCNSEGKKICRKGYFFNDKLQTCDTDWCWNAALGCQNKGKCINKEKGFFCLCPFHYTGNHCEKYVDLCGNFICSNGTTCSIKNQKIVCLTTVQKSKENLNVYSFNTISIHSMIAIMMFLIIMIFTIAITIWACRTPRKRESKSTENSLYSAHSYYPCNTSHKVSTSCLDCNLYRCSCISKPYMDAKHFYSLKPTRNRMNRSWNRSHSDILISNCDKRLSLSTLIHDDEELPLPPPVEDENTKDLYLL